MKESRFSSCSNLLRPALTMFLAGNAVRKGNLCDENVDVVLEDR